MRKTKDPNKVSQSQLVTAVSGVLAIANVRPVKPEEAPSLQVSAKWIDQVNAKREDGTTATINKKIAKRTQIQAERNTAKSFMAKMAELAKKTEQTEAKK